MGECMKCGGTGRINGFSHIASGRCFACGGTGRVIIKADAVTDAAPTTGRTWRLDSCEVYLDTRGKYTVTSKAGGTVFVFEDGEAVATDGVKNKAAAERWASRLVSCLD